MADHRPMSEVAHVHVELDGQHHRLRWPRGQILVETSLDAGIAVPHSCREGRCGSCVATVVTGRVEMVPCDVLDAADLEDGLILACQARAAGVEVRVAF
jgi:3-ketosteroid 9alpha-monooxygenase subunit B